MGKILIVDDDGRHPNSCPEILRDEGHDIILAENAAATRRPQRRPPDLVLLDIWMPDTDGVSLLKEWSANGQLDAGGHDVRPRHHRHRRRGHPHRRDGVPRKAHRPAEAARRGQARPARIKPPTPQPLASAPSPAPRRCAISRKRLEQMADKSA